MDLVFITGNAKKAEELGNLLDYPIEHQKVDLTEIQSLDLAEIVAHKAAEAFKIVQKPVLVGEDTSLVFNALGRLPGPLIKWFLSELGNDGLCKLLNGYSDRSARAETIYALYNGKELKTYHGETAGSIAKKPRGVTDFGWDPVFIPAGYDKTWAEMTLEEKSKTSMRAIALKKLETELKTS